MCSKKTSTWSIPLNILSYFSFVSGQASKKQVKMTTFSLFLIPSLPPTHTITHTHTLANFHTINTMLSCPNFLLYLRIILSKKHKGIIQTNLLMSSNFVCTLSVKFLTRSRKKCQLSSKLKFQMQWHGWADWMKSLTKTFRVYLLILHLFRGTQSKIQPYFHCPEHFAPNNKRYFPTPFKDTQRETADSQHTAHYQPSKCPLLWGLLHPSIHINTKHMMPFPFNPPKSPQRSHRHVRQKSLQTSVCVCINLPETRCRANAKRLCCFWAQCCTGSSACLLLTLIG